jgi:hypothetical protein
MAAGIREILIICKLPDLESFKKLLGDGTKIGVHFEYAVQNEPRGLADALLVGRNFIGDSKFALILGDNIFHGTKITCSGTVSFNWSFMHPVEAYVDFPQYAINGGTPIDFPTYNTGGYNGTQTGTISFPVAAGDSITIYAVTLDNDATAVMLTVSNFSAP